ncbi:MAG: sensor histidine kinase [Haloferacaceae archaeon]
MVVAAGGFLRPDRPTRLHYWLGRLHRRTTLTPLRIALLYAVFGFAGLYVSDVLLVRYLSDPLLSQAQTLKGGVEVVLTAGLVFLLTRRYQLQLERTTEQVQRQREELSVLHRVFRHNLRNDLNIILGYADELRESGDVTPECDRIVSTAERMLGYTEHAKHINAVTESDGRRRTVDLAELVPDLLATHPMVTESVDVTTDLPDCAEVNVNRMLPDALRELVTNAVKHNDGGPRALSVSVDPDAGPPWMTEVRIADNGPGVPDAELDPLRETEERGLVHLSGMGLWFVYWAVERSDGDIDFTTHDDGGTTVRVRLPTRPVVPA